MNILEAFVSDSTSVAALLEKAVSKLQAPKDARIRVCQTTFSISEEFIRRMFFLKKKFNIAFSLVVDRKALAKIRRLWIFLSEVYDEVYLAENHSKLLLIYVENQQVTAGGWRPLLESP